MSIDKIVRIFVVLTLVLSCSAKKDKIYDHYFKPKLERVGLGMYSGKIIVLANDACHKCSYYLFNKKNILPCNTVIIYDTTVYGNILRPDSCHYFIAESDDVLARINYPNIYGHRIYWIELNRIKRVKELNSMNVDSIHFFLSNNY
jgi:hypothetical protein